MKNEKCRKWIYQRVKFHLEILDYFSKIPNQIIIVNIERKGWIIYLCSQLHFNNNFILFGGPNSISFAYIFLLLKYGR